MVTVRIYVTTKSGGRVVAAAVAVEEADADDTTGPLAEWLEGRAVFPDDLPPFLAFVDDDGHPVMVAVSAVESITARVVGQAAPHLADRVYLAPPLADRVYPAPYGGRP